MPNPQYSRIKTKDYIEMRELSDEAEMIIASFILGHDEHKKGSEWLKRYNNLPKPPLPKLKEPETRWQPKKDLSIT